MITQKNCYVVSYCDVAIEGLDPINEDVYQIIGVYTTLEKAKYEAEMFIQDKLEYFVDGCRDKYEEAIEDGEIDEDADWDEFYQYCLDENWCDGCWCDSLNFKRSDRRWIETDEETFKFEVRITPFSYCEKK